MQKLNTWFFLGFLAIHVQTWATSSPESPESVEISRYIAVSVCYTGKECIGPVAKDLENSNVRLKLIDPAKGPKRSVTGVNYYRITEQGVLFRSEVRITKKAGTDKYLVYAMLRSGPTIRRRGIVKSFEISDMSELAGVQLIDQPIVFDKGTLKAELVLGPKAEISH